LHGTLFDHLQNAYVNANRWEKHKGGQGRGPFRQNQFGVAAGGPIIKNRTFIFGRYQGTRIASSGVVNQNLGYGGNYAIPTAAMRGGNFQSLLGAALAGGGPVQGTIYDPTSTATVNGPLTRTPFTNNSIPSNMIDPVARKILA